MVKTDYDLSISNILQNIILAVGVYLPLKELNLRCVLHFCYIIEPLNLSDYIINLIKDFNILQFCWDLNF